MSTSQIMTMAWVLRKCLPTNLISLSLITAPTAFSYQILTLQDSAQYYLLHDTNHQLQGE